MDIRLLEQSDIQEAKDLWKKVFEDGDEFLDFYFKNKILPGNSLGMFDGGLISVLHMIPYKIRVQGRAIETAFIAGAATAKHRRKQGLMKTLLHESLELMRSRGILLTHLYPFLHSFYEQYGWATYSYVDKMKVTDGTKAIDITETDDVSILHSLYHNFTKGKSGYVIRGEKEWKWRLDDLFMDGGKVLLLKEDDVPVCYMMYYVEDGKAQVIETVYEKKEQAQRLAEHLAVSFSEVKYNVLSQNITGSPHGMARVVDAEKLLCEFDAEDILEKAKIKDNFAAWNNVGSGKYEMDIKELARIIHMGPERAFEGRCNVMEGLQNINIKPSFTCIFEEY